MHTQLNIRWIFIILCLISSAPAAVTYKNPVLNSDAPDPSVIKDGSNYYMYVTGYNSYTSTDLVSWGSKRSFYSGADWAPDMYKHTDGKFYLYYTQSGGGGIGIAVSSSPTSGFTSVRSNMGGIDAHFFADDDGKFYLYRGGVMYMNMTNPTTPSGAWTSLTSCSQEWEREGTSDYCPNEGPYMVKHNGTYYLMYSGSGWAGPTYAVGYATSNSPTGPFTKFPANPIIRRNDYDSVWGPGHHSVVKDQNGIMWTVYHSRQNSTYDSGVPRVVSIDPLWIDSSGVMHCRATKNVTRPAPGNVIWPARNALAKIEFESHDGCHNKLQFRRTATMAFGGATLDSTYITFRNVDFAATGSQSVQFNLASSLTPSAQAGTIFVRLGGVYGQVIAECNVMGTGSGTTFQTQTFPLERTITGKHDIVLTFDALAAGGAVGNIDWLQFLATTKALSTVSAPSQTARLHSVAKTANGWVVSLATDRTGPVRLRIMTLDGRTVAESVREQYGVGTHTIAIDLPRGTRSTGAYILNAEWSGTRARTWLH